MFGFGKTKKGQPHTGAPTDSVIDDVAVLYEVGRLSDMRRVMGQELHATFGSAPQFFEFGMLGIGLNAGTPSRVEQERKIASIHFHPLEPHLRDDPVARFLMSNYGLSFEEASLLVSMNDVNHTLSVYAKGNQVAEKSGLPPFNTHETVAGTVLVDGNRNTVLAGLLPVSRLPKDELAQIQSAAQTGLGEQAYNGMKEETMRKFYDVVVDFTVIEDRQASFLFEGGAITHLVGPRFALGVMDAGLTRILRAEGDLEGTPLLTYGSDPRGALFAVLTASFTTPSGSSLERCYALPVEVIYPNQRILDALGRYSDHTAGPVRFQNLASAIRRLLEEHRQRLRRLEIGDRALEILPTDLMPDEAGGYAPMKISCIGARHSFHLSESLLAYALRRNTTPMLAAPHPQQR